MNSSLSYGQVVLTFRLPGTTSCSSYLMILLEDDLPKPLFIEQKSFKSYLPSKKNLCALEYRVGLFSKRETVKRPNH